MRQFVAILGAVALFHVVTLAVLSVQPMLRPRMVHLFRYVLQPYAKFWLDHFYFLCGIVAAVSFFYLAKVFGRDIQNPFTEMAGCGNCEGCRTEGICDDDPVNRIKHKGSAAVDDGCHLSHFVEVFREKLTREDFATIRQSLHQMKVLSVSETDELILPHCQGSLTDLLQKFLGMLDKKDDGYEKLIEVLEANANEKNWFTDLAEQLKTRPCNVCQNRGPILFTNEFKRSEFAKETWTIDSTMTEIDWLEEHGIHLSFPKCFTQGEVTIGVCFSGQFKLPPGTELASPVYSITMIGMLNKHISMEIKHCVILNEQSDEKLLNFVKAEPIDPHKPCHMYDMQLYAPDQTCFNSYSSQTGMTEIPPSKEPIRCFLLAIVKSKRKCFKVFSSSLPCSYRMHVFYSKPEYCRGREWVASIVATRDLPSFTEILKREYASDGFCFAGPSIKTCLKEDGLSVQLPMRGVVTSNGQWRITPDVAPHVHPNLKISRHQIDHYAMLPKAPQTPCINLKIMELKSHEIVQNNPENQPANSVETTPMSNCAGVSYPEVDHILFTRGTTSPYYCDYLRLHFKPPGSNCSSMHSQPAVSDRESPNEDELFSDIDLLQVIKQKSWRILNNFRLRFRVFVSLSMEISIPGAYVHVYTPNLGKQKKHCYF